MQLFSNDNMNLLRRPVPSQKFTLGCPILDTVFAGGIPCNSITELVSESGSGKTQLSLQLLLTAQLPLHLNGLSASSVYLYSEFPFPLRRLNQLCKSFFASHPNVFPSEDSLRDRILTRSLHSAHELYDALLQLDPILRRSSTSSAPLKLIVIDSIAAFFRSEFDNTPSELRQRSALFFRISAKLKWQAQEFGVAVVVTNQVVDYVGSDDTHLLLNGLRVGNLDCFYSSGRRVCPALGLSWANCVNSRIFISRHDVDENSLVGTHFVDTMTQQQQQQQQQQQRKRRRIHVVFSPHLPYSSCEFEITMDGVFGVQR